MRPIRFIEDSHPQRQSKSSAAGLFALLADVFPVTSSAAKMNLRSSDETAKSKRTTRASSRWIFSRLKYLERRD